LGKDKFIPFLTCPPWARTILFYFSLAQLGQGQIYLTSYLPTVGKGKFVLFLACPRWARVNLKFWCLPKLGKEEMKTVELYL